VQSRSSFSKLTGSSAARRNEALAAAARNGLKHAQKSNLSAAIKNIF
jgi:hypothetical protein